MIKSFAIPIVLFIAFGIAGYYGAEQISREDLWLDTDGLMEVLNIDSDRFTEFMDREKRFQEMTVKLRKICNGNPACMNKVVREMTKNDESR